MTTQNRILHVLLAGYTLRNVLLQYVTQFAKRYVRTPRSGREVRRRQRKPKRSAQIFIFDDLWSLVGIHPWMLNSLMVIGNNVFRE